jgi:hypothetical protein
MSEKESLHGLACPRCGGMLSIPEGQRIVRCPFCDMRSYVRGERGLRRYQVLQRTTKETAVQAFQRFLKSNWAIAGGAAREARLSEIFLVHLPFWMVWARIGAWAFGEEKVGSGNDTRYEPREVRIVQEMTWNGAACDVGEFGVTQVPPAEQDLHAFDPESLHSTGLVFEPVSSFGEAQQKAEQQFQAQVERRASLDRLAQLFVRSLQRRFALVYHPLWVLRYLYRGRAFQVVVDAYSGKVLYGKAPGNTIYRAGVLVLGMAFGALLAVDGPALVLSSLGDSNDGLGILAFAGILLLVGFGLMLAAYRAFRYGEVYEYRSSAPKKIAGLENPMEVVTQIKDVEQWINRLS